MAEIDRGTSGPRERKGHRSRVVIVALFVALLFAASLSLLVGPWSNVLPAPAPAGISYTSHVNISINGNAQFDNSLYPNNGVVSGNGTVSNPYIIEGWNISAAGAHGIRIQNTNAYFIVRDCYVHSGGTLYNGIYLFRSANGTLTNNNCSNNKYGINLELLKGDTLTNNTCSSNTQYGIRLYGSERNTLSGNNCSSNVLHGISVRTTSNNNTLSGNNCSSNGDLGIYLGTSSRNIVSNNTCSSNTQYGIRLYTSGINTLSNNTCSSNGIHGIYLDSSTGNTVSNNTCSNDLYGIYLLASGSNRISRNQVYNSTSYGIDIFSGFNNRIWNNTFYHNNGSGDAYDQAKNQAHDSGGINWWNSTNGYGNYWADWTIPDVAYRFEIVDLPYNITGTAGAKDYYPLTSPKVGAPPIPEFSEIVIPIVGLMMIALILGRARKKPLC